MNVIDSFGLLICMMFKEGIILAQKVGKPCRQLVHHIIKLSSSNHVL